MKRRLIEALPLVVFLFCLTYLPGITRGTTTFHVEDAMLLIVLCWRYARPDRFATMLRNLKTPAVGIFVACHIAFVTWVNVVNFFHAAYLAEVLYAVTLYRSVVFVLWVLSLENAAEILGVVVRCLPAFGLLQQAIVFCQEQNLFGVNDWLTPLYATVLENSIYSLMGLRSDGTYANPNDASIAISFFATASLIAWFEEPRILRANVYYLGSAMTALYAIVVLCKSRTGAASILFILAAYALLALLKGKRKHLLGLLVWALIAISGLGLQQFTSDVKLQERFSVFTGETRLTEEGSFAERLEMWQDGLAVVSNNLTTGLGISALVQYGWLDGGYVTYIFISGVIGLLLVIASIAPALTQALREKSLDRLPFTLVAGQIVVVTVSHALAMKDKLWIPILTIFFYLAFNRASAQRARVAPENAAPEPLPQGALPSASQA